MKQWVPIIPNWNVRQDIGTILPTVNRINNALESCNRRFNSLFKEQPMLLEFVHVVEHESCHQAEKL
jgi:hypothetical protein